MQIKPYYLVLKAELESFWSLWRICGQTFQDVIPRVSLAVTLSAFMARVVGKTCCNLQTHRQRLLTEDISHCPLLLYYTLLFSVLYFRSIFQLTTFTSRHQKYKCNMFHSITFLKVRPCVLFVLKGSSSL